MYAADYRYKRYAHEKYWCVWSRDDWGLGGGRWCSGGTEMFAVEYARDVIQSATMTACGWGHRAATRAARPAPVSSTHKHTAPPSPSFSKPRSLQDQNEWPRPECKYDPASLPYGYHYTPSSARQSGDTHTRASSAEDSPMFPWLVLCVILEKSIWLVILFIHNKFQVASIIAYTACRRQKHPKTAYERAYRAACSTPARARRATLCKLQASCKRLQFK